jgi:hypothetical protein
VRHHRGIHEQVGVRDEQLAAFHHVVERLAIGDVHEGPPAREAGQLRKLARLRTTRLEEQTQRGLDPLGRRPALSRGFALEPPRGKRLRPGSACL